MKRILFSSLLLVILAACSTAPVNLEQKQAPAPSQAAANIAEQPLRVPPLETMRDTPPRTLAGRFQASSWAALPGWQTDDLSHVWKAFINNCKGLMRPISGSLAIPARATPRAWQPVCAAAANAGISAGATGAIRQFLQAHLQPWHLLDGRGHPAENMITGYYEPTVHASRTRGGNYQWPMYAAPADLLTIDLGSVYPELAGKRVRGKLVGNHVVPYDTRADIAGSARQPPVIVWVNDPVEAFFLQIQGSGRAILSDGSTIRLAYADHNGRPYTSIGKWLADRGEMPLAKASMQNIKAWAKAHPSRVQELLNVNTAMVFFREEPIVDPELGPSGAYGIPLIGQRSVAVDTSFVPLGAPVFLSTQYPASAQPLNRLVFAQDTGAAIRGAARADFYWGSGDEAGALAGRMKQRGRMWVLWPRQAGAPSAR
ncbi:MAG TPA: murein transglycosylase A [Paralcaligenes sp.]